MRRALVVGCAMVLIGSVTAVAPADSVEADKARAMDPFATLIADRGWR